MSDSKTDMWWEEDKYKAHDKILETVRRIETFQSATFERLRWLEWLYDPYTPDVHDHDGGRGNRGGVHENAIASNVDTITAVIATTDIRIRQMTDGADWDEQRRARRIEWYAEEINILTKAVPKCRTAFKECTKKGMGLVKVTQKFDAPHVQQVMLENIVVPDDETRDGRTPTQMHEWVTVDADELIAEFPKFEDEIIAARANRQGWRIDTRTFPATGNQVIYIDSYRLPTGIKGKKGYKPGRHTKILVGQTLLDEKWEKPYFPYGVQVWSERAKSWYGISGAERIAGIQRALDKANWHIEKQNDNIALPTTFVRPADGDIQVKTTKIGAIAVCHGEYPKTVMPNAVSPETYARHDSLYAAAGREFGQSTMATHGAKPTGLDSAVALREFKDQSSDRFSPQEKGFEQLVLDVTWLLMDVCKDLGAMAPKAIKHSRFDSNTIEWGKVDMTQLRVQMQVSSNLPRTPAGRMQFVIELAQAGVISTDVSTRLLQMPDVESELSLYTAGIDSVEDSIDQIAEGHVVMPDPFGNLATMVWRGQREYLKWSRTKGAPEDRIELLRQYIVQAAWMKNGGAASANSNAPAAVQPGAMPGAQPGAPDSSAMPGGPPGMAPPGAPPPQFMPQQGGAPPPPAFSPQAMTLMSGSG